MHYMCPCTCTCFSVKPLHSKNSSDFPKSSSRLAQMNNRRQEKHIWNIREDHDSLAMRKTNVKRDRETWQLLKTDYVRTLTILQLLYKNRSFHSYFPSVVSVQSFAILFIVVLLPQASMSLRPLSTSFFLPSFPVSNSFPTSHVSS